MTQKFINALGHIGFISGYWGIGTTRKSVSFVFLDPETLAPQHFKIGKTTRHSMIVGKAFIGKAELPFIDIDTQIELEPYYFEFRTGGDLWEKDECVRT